MYMFCIVLLIISSIGILINFNSITGSVILEETEIKSEFKFVEPEEISRSGALDSLMDAEDDIKELINSNLSVLFVNDVLLEAERNFIGESLDELKEEVREEIGLKKEYLEKLLRIGKETPSYDVEKQDYKGVFRLTQLIKFKKNQAFKIIDEISLIESKEESYRKSKIDTSEGFGDIRSS